MRRGEALLSLVSPNTKPPAVRVGEPGTESVGEPTCVGHRSWGVSLGMVVMKAADEARGGTATAAPWRESADASPW